MATAHKISTTLGTPVHIAEYSDFLHYACMGNVHGLFANEAFDDSPSGWAGTATYQDAVKLAHVGWDHGTKRAMFIVDDLLERINLPMIESSMYLDTTTQYCWDMSSAVAGVPQCGVNFAQEFDKKQIRLLVNLAVSSAVSGAAILSRATVLCALIKALEFCNFSVEVTIGMAALSSRRDGLLFQYTTVIKHFTQAIDINLLSFAIGHQSMMRRLSNAFVSNTLSKIQARQYDSESWGLPCKFRGVDAEISIDGMRSTDSQWCDAKSSAQWLLAELQKQGVTLNDQ